MKTMMHPRGFLLLLHVLALQAPLGALSFTPPSTASSSTKTTRLRYPSLLYASTTAEETASKGTDSETFVDLPHVDYVYPEGSTATPVLLLHGLLGSKRNFATLAKALGAQLDTPRRIMGVDLRNHGDNQPDAWQDDMSYESMAKDVLKFLQSQNLKQIVVVGHSMGGKVAQALALMEPDMVEGLVVLDMAPVSYEPNEPHWKAVTSIIETLQSVPTGEGATKQTVDKHLQSAIPDPALRGFCLTNWNVKEKTWAIPVDKIAKQLDTLAAFQITPATGTYRGDVFFIHGGQSKFVRSKHIGTIANFFPNHMLTTIRGAGHWVHAEAPDDCIALLKRYLDR